MCDIWGLVPVAAAARPLPAPHRIALGESGAGGGGGLLLASPRYHAAAKPPPLPPCLSPPLHFVPARPRPSRPTARKCPRSPLAPRPRDARGRPSAAGAPQGWVSSPSLPVHPFAVPRPLCSPGSAPPPQSLRHHSTQIFRGKPLSPSHPRRAPSSPEALGVGFILGGGGIKDARCGCGPPQTPVSVRPLSVSSAQRSEPPK